MEGQVGHVERARKARRFTRSARCVGGGFEDDCERVDALSVSAADPAHRRVHVAVGERLDLRGACEDSRLILRSACIASGVSSPLSRNVEFAPGESCGTPSFVASASWHVIVPSTWPLLSTRENVKFFWSKVPPRSEVNHSQSTGETFSPNENWHGVIATPATCFGTGPLAPVDALTTSASSVHPSVRSTGPTTVSSTVSSSSRRSRQKPGSRSLPPVQPGPLRRPAPARRPSRHAPRDQWHRWLLSLHPGR